MAEPKGSSNTSGVRGRQHMHAVVKVGVVQAH